MPKKIDIMESDAIWYDDQNSVYCDSCKGWTDPHRDCMNCDAPEKTLIPYKAMIATGRAQVVSNRYIDKLELVCTKGGDVHLWKGSRGYYLSQRDDFPKGPPSYRPWVDRIDTRKPIKIKEYDAEIPVLRECLLDNRDDHLIENDTWYIDVPIAMGVLTYIERPLSLLFDASYRDLAKVLGIHRAKFSRPVRSP